MFPEKVEQVGGCLADPDVQSQVGHPGLLPALQPFEIDGRFLQHHVEQGTKIVLSDKAIDTVPIQGFGDVGCKGLTMDEPAEYCQYETAFPWVVVIFADVDKWC